MRYATDYILAGQTTSLCETCLALVPTKIVYERTNVFYVKYCQLHGEQKTLISTDVSYYDWSRAPRPAYPPPKIGRPIEEGCPFDCGLCKEHEQHTCAAVIEVTDDCNLRCPTCFASSFPGAGNQKSIEMIEGMLDAVIENEGQVDIVMFSGGEPTIHPQILPILRLAQTKKIEHVMLISNGVRLAEDTHFVDELRHLGKGFEVYLQFDSLERDALIDIRGEDLRSVRTRALANLESAGISTTLICVVKRGVNETQIGDIIRHALKYSCVRGVTFQPIKITGRNETFSFPENYITLSEVRQIILKEFPSLAENDFIPHPCSPESIAIGYVMKSANGVSAVTRVLFEGASQFVGADQLTFSRYEELRSMLYFLPSLNTPQLRHESLFRVAIISFLDKFNFCTNAIKKSCIHFVTAEREIIPLDAYYQFYSKKKTDQVDAAPGIGVTVRGNVRR